MKRSLPIQICHYRYDALDRLIGHTLTDEPQLQRFYSKNRLATEIQDAVKHSIVQHGDVLLAQQRFENDTFNTSLLATDQQRSITRTLSADHSIQPIAYSPYGHRLPANGMCSLLGFNGERPDPVTGHYLLGNGYRAFNPVLMRFNGPDNLSPFGRGGINSYAYCLGDPINLIDPTGNIPVFSGLWKKSSNFFKNRQVKKLTRKHEQILLLIGNQKNENFNQLYAKTRIAQSDHAFAGNPPSLLDLARAAVPIGREVDPIIAKQIAHKNNSLVYSPKYRQLSDDLATFKSIAETAPDGNISKSGQLALLRNEHTKEIYKNLDHLREQLWKNYQRMDEIRGVPDEFLTSRLLDPNYRW